MLKGRPAASILYVLRHGIRSPALEQRQKHFDSSTAAKGAAAELDNGVPLRAWLEEPAAKMPLVYLRAYAHNIKQGAGLNVPIRLAIYRDVATGTTRLAYDQPSSLMSGLNNLSLTEAAEKLDAKLAALAEHTMGVNAA